MLIKPRHDLHLTRRLFHLTGVLTLAFLYWRLPWALSFKLTAGFSVVAVIIEILRARIPQFNKFIVQKLAGSVLRRQELSGISGLTFLLFGVLVIISVYPKDVGLLALLFLAFGDPAASIFGVLYGTDKIIGQKSLQGAIAAFFVCSMVSFFYFMIRGIMVERIVMVSLFGGLIGSVSELVPVGRLDDNFTFPVISASLLWILFWTMGGL